MDAIDLDANATTPLAPAVLEAMRPHWLAGGNPESRHAGGRAARRALDEATATVARILGAEPGEVVFTSGGTEANNLALHGLASAGGTAGHAIASAIEHPAVSEPLAWREQRGLAVDRLGVDRSGRARAEDVEGLLRPETRLLALMRASNETGALQPVESIARICAARGVPVHTDAAQAVGRIPVDFHALGVATLAASAHKMHGPAGVGVLLVRRGTRLAPLLLGGSHQSGRRPGTVPVALCVGMAAALEGWERAAHVRRQRWEALRSRLIAGLSAVLGADRIVVHGPADPAERLPQTVNIGFRGCEGDALLMHLDLAGIRASLGAACASGSTQPSPVLEAMQVDPGVLRSSVRFSFGAPLREADLEAALPRIVAAVRGSIRPAAR
jgi:cysteine desulfurase